MKLIKLISFIASFSLILGFSGSSALALGLTPRVDGFATSVAKNDACQGLQQLDSGSDCSSGDNTVPNVIKLVIGILAKVVGVVSVIVIIFSGFRFITAGGDQNSVSNARNTLIYAIVGLVIAVLAQFIASDVLNSANDVKSSSSGQSGYGYVTNEIPRNLYL